jgi:CO/xanthine dehydrogenase Mo-binding subunit
MVHARNVRPPVAGAKLVSIDESSVSDIPGFIKVVTRGNYVAVVCEREEHAIKAASRLKVNWEKPDQPAFPGSDGLFDYMRNATPTSSPNPTNTGNVDTALAGAAKVVEAEYEYPFQGHVAFAPAHATADPRDNQMTIYSNDMKAYSLRTGVATFLDIPRDRVRVVYMEGPQVYGRTAADDAGFEAAYIAKEIGRPVRLQWMRHEETAWDTKGPAYVFKLRGGLDAQGNLIAWEYNARSADYGHIGYNEPDTVLVGQLMGRRRTPGPAAGGAGSPAELYNIPNRRNVRHVVSMPLAVETPLRLANLRDPDGPQVTFAGESFIDEMAAAAGRDPVEFRLKLLTENLPANNNVVARARHVAVVKAAAEAYGWDTRPSPKQPRDAGPIVTGRGIAYCNRGNPVLAVIAEVEVNLETGYVRVKRLTNAHDCGLVITPEGLRSTVQCAMLHAVSRALFEETRFDSEKVTSVDWRTYPIFTHKDSPDRIDVVIVNGDPNPTRPDLPHYGAGEPSHKPVVAAIANAIFDATGVRLRRVPFTPERVKAALAAQG